MKNRQSAEHPLDIGEDAEFPEWGQKLKFYLGSLGLYVVHATLLSISFPLFLLVFGMRQMDLRLTNHLSSRRKPWIDSENGDTAMSHQSVKEAETDADSGSGVPVDDIRGKGDSAHVEEPVEEEELSTLTPHQDSDSPIEDETTSSQQSEDVMTEVGQRIADNMRSAKGTPEASAIS